jgi:hypothetical protein
VSERKEEVRRDVGALKINKNHFFLFLRSQSGKKKLRFGFSHLLAAPPAVDLSLTCREFCTVEHEGSELTITFDYTILMGDFEFWFRYFSSV